MKARADLVGQVFGSLEVVAFTGIVSNNAMWDCKCKCGNQRVAPTRLLKSGVLKSCKECGKLASATTQRKPLHGMYKSPTWSSWKAMLNRVLNSNYNRFADYGGRGIVVCDRWLKFENFLTDMGIRPQGKTLDRKNNNGHYEPNNCKWSTPKEQAQNRRNSKCLVPVV